MSEWKDSSSRRLAENAFSSGILHVVDPCPLSVSEVHHFLEKNRLSSRLRKAGVYLLALALELKPHHRGLVVVTDDSSVQRVCRLKKIRFVSVSRGAIRKPRRLGKKGQKKAKAEKP